jgi:hypothetical protein
MFEENKFDAFLPKLHHHGSEFLRGIRLGEQKAREQIS